MCLEHINIDIPEQDYAIEFYVAGLGLTRDPYLRTAASGTAWGEWLLVNTRLIRTSQYWDTAVSFTSKVACSGNTPMTTVADR